MGTGSLILLCTLALGVLVGWIILVVAAFRQNVWWGLGSIFFGPVQLVFTAMYWREARLGFVMQLVCMVLSWGVLYNAFKDELAMEMAMAASEQQYEVSEAYPISQSLGSESSEALVEVAFDPSSEDEVNALESESAKSVPARPAPVRYGYREVTLEDLKGKRRGKIELETKTGRRHSGELVSVSSNRIELRKRMQGGAFDFHVKASEIDQIKLWGPLSS